MFFLRDATYRKLFPLHNKEKDFILKRFASFKPFWYSEFVRGHLDFLKIGI